MGMPFDDSGSMNDSSTPVWEKGNGPWSFRHIQWCAELISAGTLSAGQTIESSSDVREIDVNSPSVAHAGTGASGANRTIAYGPASLRNLSAPLIRFLHFPADAVMHARSHRSLPLNRLAHCRARQ